MSIKSDKWIRRMAASHGMIDPFEPEWEGYVTLEFSNTTLPARIYANEGVAQGVFFEADEACETSYKDHKGKHQGQTLPKI